ncbi:MAG: SCP2 sterol-binding domain-containing protein [Acidimicrobiales bacterium]
MRFLSSDWLAAVDAALSTNPLVAAATADTSLRLLQVMTGGPEGDVGYLISVDRGTTRVTPAAPHDVADVTMVSDWDATVAIATGVLASHDAFTTGRLRVRGDIDVLAAEAPALAGLSTVFDQIRSKTTYA